MPILDNVILRALLKGPSLLYGAAVRAQRWAYAEGALETVRLPVPVFCVGNLTVGGSGKTPGVLWLARFLLKSGARPAVITRGYGRASGPGLRVVSDVKEILCDAATAGDEPLLLARRLPGVPVVAAADRVLAGREAWEKQGADCLVMDDGHQHLRLFRNRNLLCVDAYEDGALFEKGGEVLLPAGRLREPLSGLNRANLVFLTKADLADPPGLARLKARLSALLPGVPLVEARYALTFVNNETGQEVPAASLRGARLLALSALARPAAFEESLKKLGANVEGLRFSDHHVFSKRELDGSVRRARRDGRTLLTTEKDAVRLPPGFSVVVARLDWLVEENSPAVETIEGKSAPWTSVITSAIG